MGKVIYTEPNYMNRAFLLISLLFAISLNSQSTNENDWGSWIMLYGTNKISNDFDVITEFRLHDYEVFYDLDNAFIRTGLNYRIDPGLSVTAGYIHQYSETRSDFSDSENRLYEEITFKNNFRKLGIAHRYRIEHRWINKMGDTDFSNRMRYRLQLSHPLFNKFYVMVFDEVFINLQESIFNQNRLHMGIGYVFGPSFKLELGYLKNHFSSTNYDLLRIGILFNTDLSKKQDRRSN
jgi:long-subunit fatty acid transport protein